MPDSNSCELVQREIFAVNFLAGGQHEHIFKGLLLPSTGQISALSATSHSPAAVRVQPCGPCPASWSCRSRAAGSSVGYCDGYAAAAGRRLRFARPICARNSQPRLPAPQGGGARAGGRSARTAAHWSPYSPTSGRSEPKMLS